MGNKPKTRLLIYTLSFIVGCYFLIYCIVNNLELLTLISLLMLFIIFRISSRVAYVIAIIITVLCAALTFFHRDDITITLSAYLFYFLVIGVILKLISLVKIPLLKKKLNYNPIEEEIYTHLSTYINIKPVKKKEILYLVYRYIGFPLLIVTVSGLMLIFLTPSVQPFFENIYSTYNSTDFRKFAINDTKKIILEGQKEATVAAKTKAQLKIRIENGSGIRGEASRSAALLINDGYKLLVEDVGNAANSNYKLTEIHYKEGLRPQAVEIAEVLKRETTSFVSNLEESNKYDILVIIGKNK